MIPEASARQVWQLLMIRLQGSQSKVVGSRNSPPEQPQTFNDPISNSTRSILTQVKQPEAKSQVKHNI